MQVAKWGNSLAVRLPAAVVQALELKEGEEIVSGSYGAITRDLKDGSKIKVQEPAKKPGASESAKPATEKTKS